MSPDATSRPRPRPVGAAGSAGIVADGRTVRRVPRIRGRASFVRP
ncbi:phosphoribosylglycinamide formyltransferase, partial [Streptomyces sp. wa22]